MTTGGCSFKLPPGTVAGDPMLYEWRSAYYPRDIYTEEACKAERQRRVSLGQFVMQQDAPGGAKQFRAFPNADAAYDFIVKQPLECRTYYETIFQEHPKQKPHFDIDIVPSPEDPMSHTELLNRLLTEIKRVVGPDLDLVDDIGVYSSHADNGSKNSYHVVLTGYYVKDNIEAGEFAKVVRDGMVAATDGPQSPAAIFITKCVDLVVYKKLQQFRLLGCTKLGRNRYKSIVLEYHAAGRTRRRAEVTDPREEFCRSLVSVVEDSQSAKRLEPACYAPAQVGAKILTDDDADALLKSLYQQGRDLAAAGSGAHSSAEVEALWLIDAPRIVAHLIDTPGHLPSDLAVSCRYHTVTTSSRGALISLKAPRANGYWCLVCERKHESENPYLTLHEDRSSQAVTEMCPRVVSIIYHCRRDPMSTMRICSMRGGGVSGMASFTCLEEPFDPRQGEVTVKATTEVSRAVDA